MNRRKVVQGGLGLITLGVLGPSWAARPCPPDLSGLAQSSCGSIGVGAGPIETLASQMSSGTWAKLTNADTGTLRSITQQTVDGTTRSAFEYCNQIFWNSNAKELHYRGGGASSGGANGQVHVRFSESNGKWDVVVPYYGSDAHQWSNFTGDPRTGDLYIRRRNTEQILKWTYQRYPATATSWPLHSTGTFEGDYDAQALEYFPDANNGLGALCFFETFGNTLDVWATDADLTTWTKEASNVFNADTKIEIFSAYLPGQKLVMFGGGNGGPYIGVLDENRIAYHLNNSPVAFGVGGTTKGSVVGHPNGRVFAVSAKSNAMWEWNGGLNFNPASPTNDTWTSRGSTPFFGGTTRQVAAAMIPEYNCIYVVSQETGPESDVEQWLYKL